jgi:hypothetical protein
MAWSLKTIAAVAACAAASVNAAAFQGRDYPVNKTLVDSVCRYLYLSLPRAVKLIPRFTGQIARTP